jgi:membrane carboxypeptidase/penicillin-binding protein
MLPETAWLVASLLPLSATTGRHASGALSAPHGTGAWFGGFTPERVVVVTVGFDDGRPLPSSGEAQRAAVALGVDVLGKALSGVRAGTFPRPSGLVLRRLDPTGAVLASTATVGTEEWFIPGSLPHEDLPRPDDR